jgi:membrane-bound metal-dependent hydrolase YbcI (DUF457 family)
MPTSVAHIIGGYAALEAGTRRSGRPGIFFLVLVVVVANLPDLDFLPGVLLGDPGLFHRGPSHSVFAAAAVAGLAGWALGPRLGGARRVALWTFIAYGSHLVLDMLIPDPSGGTAGIPVLWPLVVSELGTPIPGLRVLDDLRSLTHVEMQNGFFRGLLSLSGVRIFLLDAVLVLPLIPLAWGVRQRRAGQARRRRASASQLPLQPKRKRVEVVQPRGPRRVLVATEPAGRG